MDKNKQPPHAPPVQPAEAYDSELDYKAIIVFGAGLVGITAVVLLLMWWMSDVFKRQAEASDPPPSPIVEAREDPVPPGPRLQSIPPRDMNDMRQEDREALTSYGWVDRAGGLARIPVERAKAILLATGLPKTVAPAPEVAPVASVAPASSTPPASSAAPHSSAAPRASAAPGSSAAPRGSAAPADKADKKKGAK